MARRSKHQLSKFQLTTCDMGQLVPVGLTEVLPNDTIRCGSSAVIRLSPMAAPVMHPVTVRLHHFFVPHRIVWDGWENFITGGPDGNDSSEVPKILRNTGQSKDLFDHYGVPPLASGSLQLNALPIRGFNAIYNEWFRDQDLVTERGEDATTVPQVAWEKDYFTAARPWSQKGQEVTLPLQGSAPVVSAGDGIPRFQSQTPGGENQALQGDGSTNNAHWSFGMPDQDLKWEKTQLEADLASASAATVNDVRLAFALQRYQEVRARFGSRYTEYLRYLGANPEDHRLQRPELLAGSKARVAISEVLQTANEPTQQRFGVADMYGHGVSALRGATWQKHFNEHGYVHTLMSVRPRAIYTNGSDRHWLYNDKEDFWQRELEFIGQQAVWSAELFTEGDVDTRQTFGYADRYRHYREGRSYVTGEFRDTLDYWHMGRQFTELPVLNQSFTDCVPTKRIYNEQTADSLWCMIQHRMVARRLVAKSAYSRII